MEKHKNENHDLLSIDSIAEQWVNLLFVHIEYKRQSKKVKNINKKENKNGTTK